MKHKVTRIEIKSVSDQGTFTGYAAVFNNVDLGGDVIAPGAFAKTIQVKTNHPILWGHRSGEVIGVNQKYTEDPKGLLVEGKLTLDVQRAREAYALMKDGAVSGMSIGYDSVVDEYNYDTDVRTLKEIKLWEYSLTAFPMNPEAQVTDVKACASGQEFENEIRALMRYLEKQRTRGLPADRMALVQELVKQVSALQTAQASAAATHDAIKPDLVHLIVNDRKFLTR